MPFIPTLPATAFDAFSQVGTYVDTLGGLVANVIAKSADFNVDQAERGGEYHITSASPVIVTLRTQASHTVPQYSFFGLARLGTGSVTVQAAGGVTILSRFGYVTLDGQYSMGRLIYLGSDNWLLTGALA